jgi:1-acyl-sn-glycerol-3-phosphate acyltransferase
MMTQVIGRTLSFFCTTDVDRLPYIDPNKAHLFVSNHQSRLDAFATLYPFGLKQKLAIANPTLRIMTASSVYYSPLRLFLWACGCFPTRKHTGNYDPVTQSVAYLNDGSSVMIFPEGKRVTASESQPKNGIERIIDNYKKELVIILIHLEWSKKKGRRHLRVRYTYGSRNDSAVEMMKKIYSL